MSLAEFLAPGLVMMAMVHAAFENAASSLVQGKLLGNERRDVLIALRVRCGSRPLE